MSCIAIFVRLLRLIYRRILPSSLHHSFPWWFLDPFMGLVYLQLRPILSITILIEAGVPMILAIHSEVNC